MEKDMEKVLEKASVLVEALPYIQKFNRKIIVIKYGGSAMSDEAMQKKVIEDCVLLKLVGFKPIVVHGGGKAISKWVEKTGKEAEFYKGLRITDAETMEIAEMVLNRINKNLVAMAEQLGVRAIGISGKDGKLLNVNRRYVDGKDIGFVGDIKNVDAKILFDLLDADFLPIVAPIGLDDDFNTYNINADEAASAIARAVCADKLVYLTDITGVLRSLDEPDSLISRINIDEADELVKEGIVGGGMLPKLANCTDAVRGGVHRVHILDGRIPHCLLLEIFTDKGVGTVFYKGSYNAERGY